MSDSARGFDWLGRNQSAKNMVRNSSRIAGSGTAIWFIIFMIIQRGISGDNVQVWVCVCLILNLGCLWNLHILVRTLANRISSESDHLSPPAPEPSHLEKN